MKKIMIKEALPVFGGFILPQGEYQVTTIPGNIEELCLYGEGCLDGLCVERVHLNLLIREGMAEFVNDARKIIAFI